MKKINEIFATAWHSLLRRPNPRTAEVKVPHFKNSGALMKSRPIAWEPMTYVLVEDKKAVDRMFQRFCDVVTKELQKARPSRIGETPKFRMETGTLVGERRYIFVQPWNETGWLVEQAPSGWVIARAEKRLGTETFMRSGEAIDAVNLYANERDPSMIKVSSHLAGDEDVSWPLYERQITDWLKEAILGEKGASI